MSDFARPIVAGRGCNGCTLCCKLLEVRDLGKPATEWCQHCDIGVGCKIYETRPRLCAVFHCGFLTLPDLSEEWRPSKSKIVLARETEPDRLAAYVDPGRPNATRSEAAASAWGDRVRTAQDLSKPEYQEKESVMAWQTVEKYYLGYNIPQKQFYFYYKLQGVASVTQIFPSPAEFVALADMFRNEGPISYNTNGKYFTTQAEPVGEGET